MTGRTELDLAHGETPSMIVMQLRETARDAHAAAGAAQGAYIPQEPRSAELGTAMDAAIRADDRLQQLKCAEPEIVEDVLARLRCARLAVRDALVYDDVQAASAAAALLNVAATRLEGLADLAALEATPLDRIVDVIGQHRLSEA